MLKLEDYNNGLIYTDVEGCINCNKCIHGCPILESNVSVMSSDGEYSMCVDEKACILCGTCLDTCVHNVRHYRDDCGSFLSDLKLGKSYSVIIAPSFFLNYPDECEHVLGYLKSLGVKQFYLASFGADITTWGYLNYISKTDTYGNVAQPCPTIVRHIEMYHHELLPNIMPIQSPMMCTAIYLKRYENIDEELAFLSPCVAKKVEIESKRGLGLIRHNVTFKSLMQHIKNENINLADYSGVKEKFDFGMGALFPNPGGLGENIEYYLGIKSSVMQIEGENRSYEYLEHLADYKNNPDAFIPVLIDILNCSRGCSYGTGTEFRSGNNYKVAYQSVSSLRKLKFESMGNQGENMPLTPADRFERLNKRFENLRLDDFMCEYEKAEPLHKNAISEAEIEAIFREKLLKLSENDKHVDCSACGYPSCMDMAEAIALGINHHNNCVYFVKHTLAENTIMMEQRLKAMLDASPMLCAIFDENFNIIEVNEEAANILKLRNKQEYIDRFFELSPEYQRDGKPSREKARGAILDALETGKGYLPEWIHISSDGETIPVEVYLERVKLGDKYVAIVYARDLRESYKLEEIEKNAQQKLKAMLNASPILCAIYDENHKVLEANQAAATLFGLSDKQYYIDRFFDLCPEYQPDGTPTREKVTQILDLAFEKGKIECEWMHCTLEGKPIPCQVYLECVNLGGRNAVMAYVWDLSEQKEMLTKLEESLSREQAANNAKTKFLSNMSHEIRTPMNSVLGIAEMQLQKDTHTSETEEAFFRIYNSSRLLLSIINDILDLSKVEAGKMEILPAPYETASMIIDTVQLNLIYIGSKRIEFKLSVDENLPEFLIGDEIRVKQVLNNIISNAFKYTLEGVVSLSFVVEDIGEGDELTLVATVNDMGQGMSEEQLGSLFGDEFTRFNLKDNRAIEGSGLGLVISHKLIKMMGGEIFVESELGKGSTFTVHLPQRRKGQDVLGPTVVEKMQNLDDTQKSMKKISKLNCEPMPYGRVLVVDDVESNLHVAKGFLLPYKLAVDTAESGELAIEKIEEGEVYDIIFMDHMMPEMDGIEATRIIQGMGYDHPIVALTANALSDSVQMFMDNGFSGFISKPVDLNQLDKYLLRFIRDKQPQEVIERARRAKADNLDIGNVNEDTLTDMLVDSFLRDARTSIDIINPLFLRQELDEKALQSYTIQTHAMKSALFNIGRLALSDTAGVLETAGRGGDMAVIREETPRFLDLLHEVVRDLEKRSIQDSPEEDENPSLLRSQLLDIKKACDDFDIDAADNAFEAIDPKSCSKQTKALLSSIADHLLCGELEDAAALIDQTIAE
ncbi:MAG: ATP-binding protein [Oscillospiraceae bacterium]|nr:ATP-binding protein [Oscillospiraceae bacterium]